MTLTAPTGYMFLLLDPIGLLRYLRCGDWPDYILCTLGLI